MKCSRKSLFFHLVCLSSKNPIHQIDCSIEDSKKVAFSNWGEKHFLFHIFHLDRITRAAPWYNI